MKPDLAPRNSLNQQNFTFESVQTTYVAMLRSIQTSMGRMGIHLVTIHFHGLQQEHVSGTYFTVSDLDLYLISWTNSLQKLMVIIGLLDIYDMEALSA